jgi:hypothetical protein
LTARETWRQVSIAAAADDDDDDDDNDDDDGDHKDDLQEEWLVSERAGGMETRISEMTLGIDDCSLRAAASTRDGVA